ncbi:unnamed protein product [Blepharisma stoltei]|uniref:Uncharacterized protein n=1 Tax=Blepharisma stoltei TaxID=1481888 RepID=A0AAU9JD39_9CILI|nr:unnamed protein product [Blepharisma stoltei]
MSVLLSRVNYPEIEWNSKKASLLHRSLVSNPVPDQSYQEVAHKDTFLYLIRKGHNNWANLSIYDSKCEREELKVLETKELDLGTCIAQLPNCKLFCFGSYYDSRITLIIDENYELQKLPSGEACHCSSAIYFNKNVYCFGGEDENSFLNLSSKFDLDQNRWFKLAPMPEADCACNSVLFNRNILISGWKNKNIWQYSTSIDSFSKISYDFAEWKRKILINGERLYLVECQGMIYESEDEYSWKQIANFIPNPNPDQAYCLYNKGEIYIGIGTFYYNLYYRFSLDKKVITELQRSIANNL